MWLLLVAASCLDRPENYLSWSSLSQTTRDLRFSSAPILNWMMFFFVFCFFCFSSSFFMSGALLWVWLGGSVGGVFWGLGKALSDGGCCFCPCPGVMVRTKSSLALNLVQFIRLRHLSTVQPPPSVRVRLFALSESLSVRIESLVVFFVSSLQCGGRLARDLSGEKKGRSSDVIQPQACWVTCGYRLKQLWESWMFFSFG